MNGTRVAILSVGDELILGQIEDSNAPFLARELQRIGCMPGERRTIADDRAALAQALRELIAGNDAVIVTGGLGPTLDDITREALLDVIDSGKELQQDPAGIAHLHSWFAARGREMALSNLRQALRPPSARLLANPNGTAPGLAATFAACHVFCLPGPPAEMRPMFTAAVAPMLFDAQSVVLTAALHTIGLGESNIASQLNELMDRAREPLVGTTASDGVITIRVRATGTATAARTALEDSIRIIRERVGDIVFGRDEETLASSVGALMLARSLTLATAESCTGGLIGALVTDVAGSSAWYRGGFIPYENARKEVDLAVNANTIIAHGAVSHETAIELARGALARTGADYALSTTGIAGPSGGSESKPVGTVFIALARREGDVLSRRFLFAGNRAAVRSRAARMALACARVALLDDASRVLLWSEAEAIRVERC